MPIRPLRAPVFAVILSLLAGGVQAADKSNAYIVRGIGAQPCSEYLKAVAAGHDATRSFAIWTDGYMSSLNRYQPETYDVMPMTESEAVAQVVGNVCKLNSKQSFEQALASTLSYVGPYRVKEQSQLVEVTLGDSHAALRGSTLKWMQQFMKDQGLYKGNPDGLFSTETKVALELYQASRRIPQTGVPDSRTLGEMINQDMKAKLSQGR